MKLKFNGFLVLLVVLMAQFTLRKKELFGVVSDNAGCFTRRECIKGTTGTQTDFDGTYTIKASPTQVLIFSFIGMKTAKLRLLLQS
jgi:hypothetical protein